MNKDRDLLKQALHTLEGWANHGEWVWPESALEQAKRNTMDSITALRERLAQPEQALNLDPTPISGWGRQSVGMSIPKTEPAQPEQSPLDRMAENARELGLDYEPVQEPVAHSIVAGALFDFMGWLTTRRERLVLSSSDDAAPAADAIKDFAQMRSLSINDAQVQEWQKHLATPPRREWVGLTLDDMEELAVSKEWLAGTRWAEAKLKEKNDA